MNERRTYKTRGEAFACRELEGDGKHYTPGQMAASHVADEEVLFVYLTWVNKAGHVVAMLVCKEEDGTWRPALDGYRECGQSMLFPERKLDADYKLPEGTVRFLNEAEDSWRRPAN